MAAGMYVKREKEIVTPVVASGSYDKYYYAAGAIMDKEDSMDKFTIKVYMDDGRVFYYDVESADKAREHASAIATEGYRHNDGKVFEHYPVHRFKKVKVDGFIPTAYPDKVTGT